MVDTRARWQASQMLRRIEAVQWQVTLSNHNCGSCCQGLAEFYTSSRILQKFILFPLNCFYVLSIIVQGRGFFFYYALAYKEHQIEPWIIAGAQPHRLRLLRSLPIIRHSNVGKTGCESLPFFSSGIWQEANRHSPGDTASKI